VTGDMEWMMDGDMDMQRVLFRMVLPTVEHADRAVAVMAKAVDRTAGAKVEMSIPMELTWTGDNVTGFTLNIAGMMSASGKYSFDDKSNPYQNFLFGIVDMMEGGPMYFNKNNVVKAEMTMTTLFGPLTDVVSYAYTYDGDWPLTQTSTTVEDEEDGEYRSEHVTTRYFEYR